MSKRHASSQERIPVLILTGFLGSGKSTLVTRILRDPRFSDSAVVVNEFGEVGLDGFLVEHSPDQLVEMTTGCLCCTIRGDIRRTLLNLYERRARGEIPLFSRLIIETTGLADPAPVIHTLTGETALHRRYTLEGIVTTVDAVNGLATLDAHEESVKQVAVADRLVLTKTDLLDQGVGEGRLKDLRRRLKALNPSAPCLDRRDPAFDLRRLLTIGIPTGSDGRPDIRRWLEGEAPEGKSRDGDPRPGPDGETAPIAASARSGHEHGDAQNHHHDHDHDHNHDHKHGEDIHAFGVVLDHPMSTLAFTTALQLLIANQGERLLRVKGIVALAETPDSPIVIHGVQHIMHEPVRLDCWPDQDRRTKLMFITRGIEERTLQDFFQAWTRAGYENPEPMPAE